MGDVNQDLNDELNIVYRYLLKQGIAHVDAEDIVQETAVVTGIPEELQRFRKLDFIRASVLGVTIDKY
jgi:DNA-directed RNA polymerase specialized sigma24 family protein